MTLEANLGPQLRAARTERGMSVREVARRIGVSPSLVSQIETGKTQPSVGTLYALLTELDLSFDTLVNGGPVSVPQPAAATARSSARRSPSPVVLRKDRTALHLEGGVVWERLNTLLPDVVDFLYTTYPPGARSSASGSYMRHMGVEFGYVLVGALTITIQDQRYVVEAGDAISFDSSVPHLLANEGKTVAHGLWCVLGRALLHSDLSGAEPNNLAVLFGARSRPYSADEHQGQGAEDVDAVAGQASTRANGSVAPPKAGGAATGATQRRRPRSR